MPSLPKKYHHFANRMSILVVTFNKYKHTHYLCGDISLTLCIPQPLKPTSQQKLTLINSMLIVKSNISGNSVSILANTLREIGSNAELDAFALF